jgi:hypothetical protein
MDNRQSQGKQHKEGFHWDGAHRDGSSGVAGALVRFRPKAEREILLPKAEAGNQNHSAGWGRWHRGSGEHTR